MATPQIWATLKNAVQQTANRSQSVWAWLAEKLDFSQFRPQAAPGVLASHLNGREGPYIILKNPATKTYIRMSERDLFLWQKMDGTRTVKDLVVAYFSEYKTFAFARISTLLEELKSNQFLTEQPVGIYKHLRSQLENSRPQGQLARVVQSFLDKQFVMGGLDDWLTNLYRRAAWLIFTRPAQVLWLVVSLAGLVCFSRVMLGNQYGIISIGGSYLLGIISLIFVYMLSIFIHELSHALTVKHYGREVIRGGAMVYFGMPAFFVDTSDIWMEGKRARMAVTWAGPYSGLILAGLASIPLLIWPQFPLNSVLYQFSLLSYLAVLLNLNPLLELDGYFLLMDGLEIPMLRRKSLEFIRRGLWAKLKSLRASGKQIRAWFAEFSREERIFAIFGLLSAIWTVYAMLQAVNFWQSKLAFAANSLLAEGGIFGRFAVALGSILLGIILAAAAGYLLLKLLRQALALANRWGLLSSPWKVSAWVLVLVMLIGGLADRYPSISGMIGLAALLLAAYFASRNAQDYAGSRFELVFWLMCLVSLLLLLGEAGRLVLAWQPAGYGMIEAAAGWITILAYMVLVAAGLVLFAHTDLKKLHLIEQVFLGGGLLASYIVTGYISATRALAGEPLLQIILAVAGGLPLLAMIFLSPTLVSYWHTSTAPACVGLGLAMLALLGVTLLGISPVWGFLLLAAGFSLQQVAYRWRAELHMAQVTFGHETSNREQIKLAFGWMAGELYQQLGDITGERQTEALVGQFDNYSLAANWHVQLTKGKVVDTLPSEFSMRQTGNIYASALTLLLDLLVMQIGEKLTTRALQRAYDGIPWETREIAAQYLFPEVKRAQVLGQQFQNTKHTYQALLQRIPLFAALSQNEIDHLCSRLQTENYSPGQAIIRQGEIGDRFYIIARGSVEVIIRSPRGVSEIVNHLGRGDYFGQVALLNDSERNATCRASVPTEVLALSRADFDQLVKVCFDLREKLETSITRANLLRQMPLFADMDAQQLQLVVSTLHEENVEAGTVIIHQGEQGQTFYVIESGRVQVSISTPSGERVVNELGPGEYMGEMALLLQSPRSASVQALVPASLLTLEKTDFDRLVIPQLYASRMLEQEMSRRMVGLRRAGQN